MPKRHWGHIEYELNDEDEGDAEAGDSGEDLELHALLQTNESKRSAQQNADTETRRQHGAGCCFKYDVLAAALYHTGCQRYAP